MKSRIYLSTISLVPHVASTAARIARGSIPRVATDDEDDDDD